MKQDVYTRITNKIVAELGSAFMSADLDLVPEICEDHAAYIESWLKVLKDTAKECAGIFQRSSSCVEGRNAQLSLGHHGLHRLSERLLNALTVVHNFHIRNRDGATPAERFFQAEHGGLFKWLLENMEYPARPRKRQPVAA